MTNEKPFTQTELKHLKWKLITQDKLTAKEAHERIAQLVKTTVVNHAKTPQPEKEKSFAESFQELVHKNRRGL